MLLKRFIQEIYLVQINSFMSLNFDVNALSFCALVRCYAKLILKGFIVKKLSILFLSYTLIACGGTSESPSNERMWVANLSINQRS